MNDTTHNAAKRRLNFFQTVKTVLWGLFGIRKGKGWEEDLSRVNPLYLVVAALLATLVFVVSLVKIAQWLVH